MHFMVVGVDTRKRASLPPAARQSISTLSWSWRMSQSMTSLGSLKGNSQMGNFALAQYEKKFSAPCNKTEEQLSRMFQ